LSTTLPTNPSQTTTSAAPADIHGLHIAIKIKPSAEALALSNLMRLNDLLIAL